MKGLCRFGIALGFAGALANPLVAQDAAAPAEPPASTAGSPAVVADSLQDPEPYEYLIAPGDVLSITVWKEPSLSTEAAVRLDGKITVPLMGDILAEGRSPDELTLIIRGGLLQFLEVPQVTVSVAQALSARFYVIGEVTISSSFPLTGRITVLQALATAGGFLEFAKRERIMIIRESRGIKQAIPFNFREIEQGLNLQQNIVLKPGDTVVVP